MANTGMSLQVLVLLVALALAFDFMNGFHDAANSIATVVSTRVLRPQWAVAGRRSSTSCPIVFGVAVAATVGRDRGPGWWITSSSSVR
jgi:PiT family inorganic phosphate transporter